MRFCERLGLAYGMLWCGAALADPVWDPTEIARLSEQAAQLAMTLSAVIENSQALGQLASEVGPPGAHSVSLGQAPQGVAPYSAGQSATTPSARSALQLISSNALDATQGQQLRAVFKGAYQDAAADGFAVSQVANQSLRLAMQRSLDLAGIAASTQDLRADLQANSAVCLGVLSELGAIEAILALLLEEQSLGSLTAAKNGAGS